METLKYRYGRQAIINLLGSSLIGSKEGEAMLSVEFQVDFHFFFVGDISPYLFFRL